MKRLSSSSSSILPSLSTRNPKFHLECMDLPASTLLQYFVLILEWNDLCFHWFLAASFSSFKSYLATTPFVELLLIFP